MNFKQCVERYKTLEQLTHDAADIKPEAALSNFKINDKYKTRSTTISLKYICIRCGARAKHLASQCYAIKITCNKRSTNGLLAKLSKSAAKTSNSLEAYTDDDVTSFTANYSQELGALMTSMPASQPVFHPTNGRATPASAVQSCCSRAINYSGCSAGNIADNSEDSFLL